MTSYAIVLLIPFQQLCFQVLGSASNRPARVDPGPPPTYEQAVSQYDEDMGYR